MKRLGIILAVFTLIMTPILAQDDADDDGGNTSTPPTIVSITPDEAVITGIGYVLVEVTYEDPDTDAVGFEWSMVDTDMMTYLLPAGRFNQALVGETIIVPFNCTGTPYTAEIALEVVDSLGNRSDPESFNLVCESAEEVEPTPDPAAEDTNTAPTIVSIDPAEPILTGRSTIVVDVTYEDPDGDAVLFDWTMVETNARTWTLPDGSFTQSAIGTTIPVTFFCTTPTFEATIELVVEDANGNQSDPETFELKCTR